MSWLSFLLAGFQVATYGRFWVATEATSCALGSFAELITTTGSCH
jgi:hypothetical protein